MKPLISLLILVFVSSICYSQMRTVLSADSSAVREARSLKQRLGLNDQQSEAIRMIRKTCLTKIDSIVGLHLDSSLLRKSVQSLIISYRKAIENILLPQQFTDYKAFIFQQRTAFRANAQANHQVVREIDDYF